MDTPSQHIPEAVSASSSALGYFLLSQEEMWRIDELGGSHYDMATYVVLSSGINSRRGGRHSTHGAKSVQRRTGMSYRQAQNSIAWLVEHAFLWPTTPDEPHGSYRSAGSGRDALYLVSGSADRCTPISQALLSEAGHDSREPSLVSLFLNVSGYDEIPRCRAVIDVLLTYVGLLDAQDFGTFGGVDPRVWGYRLHPVDDEIEPAVVTAKTSLGAKRNAELVTVEAMKGAHVPAYEWLSQMLGGHSSNEPTEGPALASRFERALKTLRVHLLVYDVIELWDGDPLSDAGRRRAEPWCTLYVSSKWARRSEPQAAFEVHEVLWTSGARDRREDFAEGVDSFPWLGTGEYRYLRPIRARQQIHAIGQLRARPWPSDEATVSGRKLDQRRTQSYVDWIRRTAVS